MRKFTLIILISLSAITVTSRGIYNLRTDSLTYEYYLAGNWKELIDSIEEAQSRGIDFKYLRQRAGYAHFMLHDYFKSQVHYEKAVRFDPTDSISYVYLYYSSLNKCDQRQQHFYGNLLPAQVKAQVGYRKTQLINCIDLEYSFQTNNYSDRGNPNYYRLGVHSQLNDRLSVYQNLSFYTQANKSISIIQTDNYFIKSFDSTQIKQFDYNIRFNYSFDAHTELNVYDHYVHTNVRATKKEIENNGHTLSENSDSLHLYPGNLIGISLYRSFERIKIGSSASLLCYDNERVPQYGLHLQYDPHWYLYPRMISSIYYMHEGIGSKMVCHQSLGLQLFNWLWLETNIYEGNLNYFCDKNGLYLYNSLDPIIFKLSTTPYFHLSKKVSIFGNYSYDRKETDTNIKYKQHSFSGGIIWKF